MKKKGRIKIAHVVGVGPQEVFAFRPIAFRVKITRPYAILDPNVAAGFALLIGTNEFDIHGVTEQRRQMFGTCGQVGAEPQVFTQCVMGLIGMQVDFFSWIFGLVVFELLLEAFGQAGRPEKPG